MEQQAARIAEPACGYQQGRDRPNRLIQRYAPSKAKPAHGKEERDGNTLRKWFVHEAKNDAREGKRPDRYEEDPARVVPEWQQCKRRIGACDKEKNTALVNFLENRLDSLVLDAVIEGRCQKGREHRSAVDDDGRAPPWILLKPSLHYEIFEAHDACRSRNALDRGARNLVPEWSHSRLRAHCPFDCLPPFGFKYGYVPAAVAIKNFIRPGVKS